MQKLEQLKNFGNFQSNINENIKAELEFLKSLQTDFLNDGYYFDEIKLHVDPLTSAYFDRKLYLELGITLTQLQDVINITIRELLNFNGVVDKDGNSIATITLKKPIGLILNQAYMDEINWNWNLIDKLNEQIITSLISFGVIRN